MSDRTIRGVRRLAVVVLAALVLVACDSGGVGGTDRDDRPDPERTTMSEDGRKVGTGEERHDLEPLTKRFTALGDPVEATWFSGEVDEGRASVPPTIYWIDAVVTVTPETMGALTAGKQVVPASEQPDVVPALRSALPAGDLVRTDPAVDLGVFGFGTQVWLDVENDQVVVTAEGTGN